MGKYFQRRVGFRKTKKVFVVVTEGEKTEKIYFDHLRPSREALIQTRVLPTRKSEGCPSPDVVLARAEHYVRTIGLRNGDEVWLVIDRDSWDHQLLDQVTTKAAQYGYHVAVSNPCFELWLYLHLANHKPFRDRKHCCKELDRLLAGYVKGNYDIEKLMLGVKDAIIRAERSDSQKAIPWPKDQATRVYKLVKKLTQDILS